MRKRNALSLVTAALLGASQTGCNTSPTQTVTLPTGPAPTERPKQARPETTSPTPAARRQTERPTLPPDALTLAVGANLDGTGPDELVGWQQTRLVMFKLVNDSLVPIPLDPTAEEQALQGTPSHMVVGQLDGDGREDVLIGYGQSRAFPNPPLTVGALRLKGTGAQLARLFTTVYQVKTERPQVTGLLLADLQDDKRPELLVAHFDDKYTVSAHSLTLPPGPTALDQPLKSTRLDGAGIRMATSWTAPVLRGQSRADLVIGRPYGEEKLSPGDLFVLRDGKRLPVPTQLGVRSLTHADLDGDGVQELIFGDGWHYDYGKVARGRLSIATETSQGWKTQLIEDTEGQYEIGQVEVADVDGDHQLEIVAAGNQYVKVYWRTGQQWYHKKVADGDGFALLQNGTSATLVVTGVSPTAISLRDVRQGGTPVPAPKVTP